MTVYYYVFSVQDTSAYKIESFSSKADAKKRYNQIKKEADGADVDNDSYWLDLFDKPWEHSLRKAVVNNTNDLIKLLNNII